MTVPNMNMAVNMLWLYERVAIELAEAIEAIHDVINVERADPIDLSDNRQVEQNRRLVYRLRRNIDNEPNGVGYVANHKAMKIIQRELDKRRERNISVVKAFRIVVKVYERRRQPYYTIIVDIEEVI
jgi:hypothetical protein